MDRGARAGAQKPGAPPALPLQSILISPAPPSGEHLFLWNAGAPGAAIERMEWIVGDIAKDYETFAGSKRHITDLEVIRQQGEMAGGSFP
jgi:hypothetical protein